MLPNNAQLYLHSYRLKSNQQEYFFTSVLTKDVFIPYNQVRNKALTLEGFALYKAKVTSKGQVTLPKELREKIGIVTGSYIEINETEMGYVIKKQVKDDCLKKYIGILDEENSSDGIVGELRGE